MNNFIYTGTNVISDKLVIPIRNPNRKREPKEQKKKQHGHANTKAMETHENIME